MTDGPRLRAFAAPLLAFAVTGGIHFATMGRGCGFIDRGELAAATILGIAHPTGYPTHIVLGHLAVRLVPGPPVLVLNALSALWTAIGVALAAGVIGITLQEAFGRRHAQMPPGFRAVLPSLGAAFLGLSTVWWTQTTGFEVYSLHALFPTQATFSFFRYIEGRGRPRTQGFLSGSAFLLLSGLGSRTVSQR